MTLPVPEAPAAGAPASRAPIDSYAARAGAGVKRRRPGVRFLLHAIVILIVVAWLVPTLGLFINSFRPAADVSGSGWWNSLFPPWNFTLDNYTHVLEQNNLGDAFINSLFITIPSTIIPIVVASFAAYAFAWMQFPFKNAIFVAIGVWFRKRAEIHRPMMFMAMVNSPATSPMLKTWSKPICLLSGLLEQVEKFAMLDVVSG
jgi:hypothetical protein